MLHERIKFERERLNLSQKELSNKINVSQQTIASWEVGRTEPSNENLNVLCAIFNTSVDYLLCKTDIRNYDNIDEEFAELFNDPELLVAFKDFHKLSVNDKKEIINFIKFKKNNN